MFEKQQQPAGYSTYTVDRPLVWAKRGVLVAVVIVFAGLIWYVASNRDNLENETLNPQVVHAPDFAVKERATEPSGMEVPFRDKEVFDLLAQNHDQAGKVELQPAPVKPIEAPKEAPKMEAATPAAPVAATPNPVTAAPVVAKQVEKPAPVAMAANGSWGVQLGSYRSHEDATEGSKVLKAKHGSLLQSLEPTIKRVELSKGTFYRVIFGGLANKDAANTLCQKFKAKDQGCLSVKL